MPIGKDRTLFISIIDFTKLTNQSVPVHRWSTEFLKYETKTMLMKLIKINSKILPLWKNLRVSVK